MSWNGGPGVLVISKSQMKVFGEAARRRFEDKMVEHLGRFSPPLSTAVGECQLRRVVRLGIERAGSHGFTHQGPVRLYLELMLLFGCDFDTDPRYSWAARILLEQDSDSQMRRAEWLYERTLDFQAKVGGGEDGYVSGLRRDIGFVSRMSRFHPVGGDLVSEMVREVTKDYPREVARVGEEGMRRLIQRGVDSASGRQLSSVREVVLLIMLMLIFGHGCVGDPLYPWIMEALGDATETDRVSRVRRMEGKALAWLERVLEYHAGGVPS
jgi:hypothetical protein